MTPSAENPYAPPAIDEAAALQTAPAAFGWRIENGKLWLNEQSLLPMVDPLTGETSERMTMVPVKILFRPRWLWVFPIMGAIAGRRTPDNVPRLLASAS